MITPVGHLQHRFRPAGVHPDSVWSVELTEFLSQPAEGADVLALAIVLVDITRSISISHVNVAIGGYGKVGWAIHRAGAIGSDFIGFGLRWVSQREDLFAFQSALRGNAVQMIADIQIFRAAFFSDEQTVSAALKLLAPGSDEFALIIENDDCVGALTGGVNGVFDVD